MFLMYSCVVYSNKSIYNIDKMLDLSLSLPLSIFYVFHSMYGANCCLSAKLTAVFDFKFKRRPSQKVLLTKLPSTDSLSNSPAPSSPGEVFSKLCTDHSHEINKLIDLSLNPNTISIIIIIITSTFQ